MPVAPQSPRPPAGQPRGQGPAWALGAGAATLAVWGMRVLPAFAPGTTGVRAFSSDWAIPLLMANAPHPGTFHLFYLGQDRFGAWPFLLADALRALGLGPWTPARLFALQAGAVLGAVALVGALGGRWAAPLAALVASAMVLDPLLAREVFDLSQPYAWQFAALFAAWALLRRALATGRGWPATALAAALAIWTSPLDTPLLLALACVEAWAAEADAGPAAALRRLRQPVLALASGWLLAWAVAWFHRVYSGRAGYWFQRSAVHLDRGHLLEDLLGVADALGASGWALALTALALALATLRRGEASTPLGTTTLGGATSGWLALTAISATDWMRLNAYAARYLAPARALWAVAVAAGALSLLGRRRELGPGAALGAGAAVLAVGALLGPAPVQAPDQAEQAQTAAALAALGPDTVVLGGYWETYVWAGLRPEAGLVPVVAEGEFDRTPWTSAALLRAARVLVAHAGTSRYGPPEAPVPFICERGTLLALEQPDALASGDHHFSWYRNVTALAGRPELRLQPDRCSADSGRAVDGHSGSRLAVPAWAQADRPADAFFAPAPSVRLLLFFGDPAESVLRAPLLRAEPLGPDGEPVPGEVRVERGADYVVVDARAAPGGALGGLRLARELEVSDARCAPGPPPEVREAWLLP